MLKLLDPVISYFDAVVIVIVDRGSASFVRLVISAMPREVAHRRTLFPCIYAPPHCSCTCSDEDFIVS